MSAGHKPGQRNMLHIRWAKSCVRGIRRSLAGFRYEHDLMTYGWFGEKWLSDWGIPLFQTYCRGNYNCFPFAGFTSNSNIYIYIYIYTLVSKHNGDIVLVSSDLMGPNVDNQKRVFMLSNGDTLRTLNMSSWEIPYTSRNWKHHRTKQRIFQQAMFDSGESITEMETNPTNMIGWILDTIGISPSNGPFPNQVKSKSIKGPVKKRFRSALVPWFRLPAILTIYK